MAFYEEKVKGFMVFRSSVDNHLSISCQEPVKEAIEKAGFGGVYFTSDLGNRFTSDLGEVSKTN